MKNIQFSVSEIDTKGVETFDYLVATTKSAMHTEQCAQVAKLILQYSSSEAVKQYVRKKFAELIVNQYSFLLGDSANSLDAVSAKLINLYCNRAYKKLDISTDIDVFSELASKYVDEGVTLLHYDRLYTLFQSVKNTMDVDGDIIELGVYKGGGLKFIRDTVNNFGHQKNIFGFDTFCGHVNINEYDGGVQKKGLFATGGIKEIEAYIGDSEITLVEGDVSATLPEYAKTSRGISFAHLDMDVYQPTADALPIVFELLPPGGIILLDDYGFTSCPGVKRAADDFLQHVSATSLHLMTGQMVIVK